MSRFKELRRIETAIKDRHTADLEWAKAYCSTRLQLATRKDHQKYWRNVQRRVHEALALKSD